MLRSSSYLPLLFFLGLSSFGSACSSPVAGTDARAPDAASDSLEDAPQDAPAVDARDAAPDQAPPSDAAEVLDASLDASLDAADAADAAREAGPDATTCDDASARCGAGCVDLQTDPSNCGSCGNTCSSSERCVEGRCATPCTPSQTRCLGLCRDTDTDRFHCGACGNACGAGELCQAGRCVLQCVTGTTACAGSCRNLATDPGNCGVCGNACPSPQVCSQGSCASPCSAGLTYCGGGACADLLRSATNCGACGRVCPSGQQCLGGTCGTACTAPTVACGGLCVSLASDQNNCGACGVACPSRPNASPRCASSACAYACDPGWADCDLDPSNGCEVRTDTDANNCGSCGRRCTTDATQTPGCSAGQCTTRCAPGRANCDGNTSNGCETELSSAASDCGRCGNSCPAPANGAALCASSACGYTCPAGTRLCPGLFSGTSVCADTQSDRLNCGGCGVLCPSGQSCIAGACTAVCAAGLTPCGASMACRDLSADAAHCGACGRACRPGASCVGGTCLEPFSVATVAAPSGCVAQAQPGFAGAAALVGGVAQVVGTTASGAVAAATAPPGSARIVPGPQDLLLSNYENDSLLLPGDALGPLQRGTGRRSIDRLWYTFPNGERVRDALLLSRPLSFDTDATGAAQGLYSGFGYVAIHTDTVYEIDLRTGAVAAWASATGASIAQPARQGSLAPATSGLLESVGSSRYLVYVQDASTVARLNLQTGAVTTVLRTRVAGLSFPMLGSGAGLTLSGRTMQWAMPLVGSTFWGSFTAGLLVCPATFQATVSNFSVTSLSTTGCDTLELGPTIGDGRGPIAYSDTNVFVTGRDGAAVALLSHLPPEQRPVGVSTRHVLSNVATGELYGLYSGSTPLLRSSATTSAPVVVDRLVPLSPATLAPTGPGVALSPPLSLRFDVAMAQTTLASGWNRALLLTDGRAWNIELPSGRTSALGVLANPTPSNALGERNTALVETTNSGQTSLLFVANPSTLRRVTFGGASADVVASTNLFGDTFGVALDYPARRLLYWSGGASALVSSGAAHLASCPATFAP